MRKEFTLMYNSRMGGNIEVFLLFLSEGIYGDNFKNEILNELEINEIDPSAEIISVDVKEFYEKRLQSFSRRMDLVVELDKDKFDKDLYYFTSDGVFKRDDYYSVLRDKKLDEKLNKILELLDGNELYKEHNKLVE